jgi:hypothetical protein
MPHIFGTTVSHTTPTITLWQFNSFPAGRKLYIYLYMGVFYYFQGTMTAFDVA